MLKVRNFPRQSGWVISNRSDKLLEVQKVDEMWPLRLQLDDDDDAIALAQAAGVPVTIGEHGHGWVDRAWYEQHYFEGKSPVEPCYKITPWLPNSWPGQD